VSADKHESSNPQWRLPVLQGLLTFDKSRLGPDIIAGITLAALGMSASCHARIEAYRSENKS